MNAIQWKHLPQIPGQLHSSHLAFERLKAGCEENTTASLQDFCYEFDASFNSTACLNPSWKPHRECFKECEPCLQWNQEKPILLTLHL